MEELKFCRICLVTDVTMYSLDNASNESLGFMYKHLAEIQICHKCQHVCFECASLLRKFYLFKLKCLRAHGVLCNIAQYSKVVTKEMIQNVNRRKMKLESNLSFSAATCYEPTKDLTNRYPSILRQILSKVDNNLEKEIKSEMITDNYEVSYLKNDNNIYGINENCYKEEIPNIKENNSLKEYKPKKINIIYGKQIADTRSPLEVIKASLDDFENEDFIEYLDENILAEVDESVIDNCKTTITKEPKPKRKKMQSIMHKNKFNGNRSKRANKITHNRNTTYKIDWNSEFKGYGTVIWLTPSEARKEFLKRKDSNNYKLSPFTCEFCYRGYEIKATYDNHMKQHNVENGQYECDICHLRFTKPRFLRGHKMKSHMRKFRCKLCPFICYCMDQAKTHVNLHKGKKYTCTDCGEIFCMPNSLFMHKRIKHLVDAVTECVCDLCGNIFGSMKGLMLHQSRLHKSDKNDKEGPKCEECGVHFASQNAWNRHIVLSFRHANKSPYVDNGCKHCGERFASEQELKSHIRANHLRIQRKNNITINEMPGPCAVCGKWLSDWIEHDNHMYKDHPIIRKRRQVRSTPVDTSSYVCEVCGLSFKLQRRLVEHQRRHTGERPYKCEDCGKCYQTAGVLYIHRKTHTETNKYICDTCGKVFSRKGSICKHIRMHLGIRPCKCLICGKSFPHMCELKLHTKYVHDKVPWPKRIRNRNVAKNNTSQLK